MKLNPPKHWLAKLLSLGLAAAIWFLIKDHITGDQDNTRNNPGEVDTTNAPKASPVKE